MDIPKSVYWKVITLHIRYIWKVPIERKCDYWPKMCLLNKMSIESKGAYGLKMYLLNKNVSTNKKSVYLMKMPLLKGHNLLGINSSLYSFGNFFSISYLSSFLKIQKTYWSSPKLLFIKPNKLDCICGRYFEVVRTLP